jgi:putative transposase
MVLVETPHACAISEMVSSPRSRSRSKRLFNPPDWQNATDAMDGILTRKRHLIHDRDPLFTAGFQGILAGVGVTSVKLPPQSPNLNAYAERFVRSIKESCLERLILFGENSLRTAAREFVAHYLRERHHQGLGNRLIIQEASEVDNEGAIECHQRLGGMLNYYYRAA